MKVIRIKNGLFGNFDNNNYVRLNCGLFFF